MFGILKKEEAFKLYVIFTIIVREIDAQCSVTYFGEPNPASKSGSIDLNIDHGYILDDVTYTVDCCAIVTGWQAFFDGVTGSRTIYFQVWRPETGSTYRLIGQNSITITTNGEQSFSLPLSDQFTVLAGDVLGWWSSGSDVISFKFASSPNSKLMALDSKSVGDVQDWSSATIENTRTYAIRMDISADNAPLFTNLPNSVNILASTPVGTSLFTISVDDADVDQISTLSVMMSTHSDYSFNTSTYELTTFNSFTVSAVDTLTFDVIDVCGNVDTGTLTITITNQGPVLDYLTTALTVSEGQTLETLLYTLNVTDPEDDPITCSLGGVSPICSSFSVNYNGTDYGVYSNENPGFDYETISVYLLDVVCSDIETTSTATFTVEITPFINTPPEFTNLPNTATVASDSPIGTVIFTVFASDVDVGDVISFTRACDTDPCLFQILTTGVIQISEDLSSYASTVYNLVIYVSDGSDTAAPETLTISITVSTTTTTNRYDRGVYEDSREVAMLSTIIIVLLSFSLPAIVLLWCCCQKGFLNCCKMVYKKIKCKICSKDKVQVSDM